MGAWGSDAFANDDATDSIADLESVADQSVLQAAFEPALSNREYIEAPVGSASSRPPRSLQRSEESRIPDFHRKSPDGYGPLEPFDDDDLVERARKAITIIGEDIERSELRQLWDEAAPEDASAWRDSGADVRFSLVLMAFLTVAFGVRAARGLGVRPLRRADHPAAMSLVWGP